MVCFCSFSSEISRRTVRTFKTILTIPVPWGSRLHLPQVTLKPAADHKSWSGRWTGAKGRREITLYNSGFFEMKIYHRRTGELLQTVRAWTKPLQ